MYFWVSYGGEESRKTTQISACVRRGDANVSTEKNGREIFAARERGRWCVQCAAFGIECPSTSGRRSVELWIGNFWVVVSEEMALKMNEGWGCRGERELRITSLPGDRKERRRLQRRRERRTMRKGTEGKHCSKNTGALSARSSAEKSSKRGVEFSKD